MFIHSLRIALLTASCCWLAACSSPTAPEPAGNVPESSDQSNAGMPFPKLEKGMSAEAIRQKLGAPAEIQAMAPVDGNKSEVWIYHYKKDLGLTQVASGTRDVEVMAPSGTTGVGMTTIKEPTYSLAEKTADITLSLLMFNGRLQVQKAKVEVTLEHH